MNLAEQIHCAGHCTVRSHRGPKTFGILLGDHENFSSGQMSDGVYGFAPVHMLEQQDRGDQAKSRLQSGLFDVVF
jgi:hypothetical protein